MKKYHIIPFIILYIPVMLVIISNGEWCASLLQKSHNDSSANINWIMVNVSKHFFIGLFELFALFMFYMIILLLYILRIKKFLVLNSYGQTNLTTQRNILKAICIIIILLLPIILLGIIPAMVTAFYPSILSNLHYKLIILIIFAILTLLMITYTSIFYKLLFSKMI